MTMSFYPVTINDNAMQYNVYSDIAVVMHIFKDCFNCWLRRLETFQVPRVHPGVGEGPNIHVK